MDMRKRILGGSLRFLEKQFDRQMETTIRNNERDANMGGVPGVIPKARAYIRVRAARKELGPDTVELQMINEDYAWAMVYYLLRAGHTKEAADYVEASRQSFNSFDSFFAPAIKKYAQDPNRRLTPDLQQKLQNEYHQQTRLAPEKSLDPYRVAVYKIIGRCELSRRSIEGINGSWEDWIWLQFCLAREGNRAEESASEFFGLEALRATISDIGQRHFAPGSDALGGYGTFFLLQILAGMFEQAVAWLYPNNHVAAVHFAVALAYYGLLRVADFTATELRKACISDPKFLLIFLSVSYNVRQQSQINFGLMLGHYTASFRAARPEAAADYIILICLNADLPGEIGGQQRQLCYEGLRELVLETREFAQLLGDIRADGQRIKGAIEQ
ncbi:hypothetical protein LTS18_013960, partial [Coniosporium uncinatum]